MQSYVADITEIEQPIIVDIANFDAKNLRQYR